ncbi:MAG: SUMF1/EgtB/PvdO family nonheme iron enzyme [Cyanobacteriota bacterium]
MIICPVCKKEYEKEISFCDIEECGWEFDYFLSEKTESLILKEKLRLDISIKKYEKIKYFELLIKNQNQEIEVLKNNILSYKKNNLEEIIIKNDINTNIIPKLFKKELYTSEINIDIENIRRNQFESIKEYDKKINESGIFQAGKIKLTEYLIEEEKYLFNVEWEEWLQNIINSCEKALKIDKEIAKNLYQKNTNNTIYVKLASKNENLEIKQYLLDFGNDYFIESEKIKGLDFVLVKKGSFIMGSNEWPYSKPVHTVELNYDFYINKFQVTQEVWKNIMKTDPSNFKGYNLPVEQITWYDAIKFCNELSKKVNLPISYDEKGNLLDSKGKKTKDITKVKGYRLPTEAEWEFSAQGGNNSQRYKYSGSNDVDSVAFYNSNSENRTHEVGLKNPNELGIYDMSGNVWEWCTDFWEYTYTTTNTKNPVNLKESTHKVCRGGSWYNDIDSQRSSNRASYPPVNSYFNQGFRIVKTY